MSQNRIALPDFAGLVEGGVGEGAEEPEVGFENPLLLPPPVPFSRA